MEEQEGKEEEEEGEEEEAATAAAGDAAAEEEDTEADDEGEEKEEERKEDKKNKEQAEEEEGEGGASMDLDSADQGHRVLRGRGHTAPLLRCVWQRGAYHVHIMILITTYHNIPQHITKDRVMHARYI